MGSEKCVHLRVLLMSALSVSHPSIDFVGPKPDVFANFVMWDVFGTVFAGSVVDKADGDLPTVR